MDRVGSLEVGYRDCVTPVPRESLANPSRIRQARDGLLQAAVFQSASGNPMARLGGIGGATTMRDASQGTLSAEVLRTGIVAPARRWSHGLSPAVGRSGEMSSLMGISCVSIPLRWLVSFAMGSLAAGQ